jgi:hypothetical protein
MAKGEIGDLLVFFRDGVLVVVLRGPRGARGGVVCGIWYLDCKNGV